MSPTGSDLDDAAVQRLLQTSVDQNLLRIGTLPCPDEACKETVADSIHSDSIIPSDTTQYDTPAVHRHLLLTHEITDTPR